jgi:hypothetical protein
VIGHQLRACASVKRGIDRVWVRKQMRLIFLGRSSAYYFEGCSGWESEDEWTMVACAGMFSATAQELVIGIGHSPLE